MEHFGHFFEFFAALNSAYIVSNHFIQSLILKINNHFVGIDNDLKLIHKLEKNNRDRLIQEGDSCAGVPNAEGVVRKLNEEIEKITVRITELDEKIATAILGHRIGCPVIF